MKLLFTRLQEEITTVKKSVTQFRVETGRTNLKTAELPVIELTPESQVVERGEALRLVKASHDNQKTPPALNAKAEGIRDIVDIQGMSKKNTLLPVAYSASRALKTDPYPATFERDSRLNSENDYYQNNVLAYHSQDNAKGFSALDERRARFQYIARKFISTQEMIEYHTANEKRTSFELTI